MGAAVVFSGLSQSGISDLYRVTLPGGALEKLTDDRYQDLDPSLSADGHRAGLRLRPHGRSGMHGAINLFVLDLATRTSASSPGSLGGREPPMGLDGRMYFASDRDGVLNVFSVDSARQRPPGDAPPGPARSTRRPCPTDDGLLVGGFHDLSWNIYYYPPDSAAQARHVRPGHRGTGRGVGLGSPGDSAVTAEAGMSPTGAA